MRLILFILLIAIGPISFAAEGHHLSCYQKFQKIIDDFKSEDIEYKKLDKVETLDDLEAWYGEESFYDLQKIHTETFIKNYNKKLFHLLKSEAPLDHLSEKIPFIDHSQAKKIYLEFEDNPIHKNQSAYEPSWGSLGYCFGRATIFHMDALRMGIHPKAIKKIWVTGEMLYWEFHVATIIRGEKGQWFVFDDHTGMQVSVSEWVKKMKEIKKQKELMFFVTDAARFAPSENWKYSPLSLFGESRSQDYYKGYFRDLFNYYHDLFSLRSNTKEAE